LAVAAVSTGADLLWYSLGVRHTVTAGVVHGAVVLMAVGGALGAASGHFVRGLPVGAIAGVAGAVTYYIIVALFGGGTYGAAIPAAWVLTWIYLAALDGRWIRREQKRPWTEIAVRGLLAAVLGGVAFYLVMNTIWGRPPAGGRNYALQFGAWAFAWAPGLLALGLGRARLSGARPVAAMATDPAAITPVRLSVPNEISGADLLARIDAGETLHILDVRWEAEFEAGHVPGAVNVPFMQVAARIAEVPGGPDDELIVYCGHGPRAYIAASSLRSAGRTRIVYLGGHWSRWEAAGLRSEP
jgi:rhodanese-related sulfurtransferase